ncbi:hypothetical protein QL285_007947 [Trifolium repens]|nr:hypothetical protein QL285_007947 [Trifolium repens]
MSYDKWHSLHASFFLLLHSRCLMTNDIHFMFLSSSLLHLDPSIALKMSYDKWHSLHASFFLLLHSRCLMTNGTSCFFLPSIALKMSYDKWHSLHASFYCTQDVL